MFAPVHFPASRIYRATPTNLLLYKVLLNDTIAVGFPTLPTEIICNWVTVSNIMGSATTTSTVTDALMLPSRIDRHHIMECTMKTKAPALKHLLMLLFAVTLTACKYEDPPLSIFQWRAASSNVGKIAHAGNGEFYLINKTGNLDRFQLSRYEDQRELFKVDIPADQTASVSLKVSKENNGGRLIAIVTSQAASHTVYLFDQNGKLLQQANFTAWEQATEFNAAGNELYIVQHNQTDTRIARLVNSALQERWHQNGNTLRPLLRSAANGWILQLSGRTVISFDSQWQSRWSYTAAQGQDLGEPFVSSSAAIMSQKEPTTGTLFLALDNGEDSFVPSTFEREIISLGNDGNPYVVSNLEEDFDDRRLRKINRDGQVLFQSVAQRYYTNYEGIQNLREMSSGQVIVMTTVSSNGGLYEDKDTSKIEILNSAGQLERSYTALPTITTLNGCVEFCKIYTLQAGYSLYQLFIEDDGDLYATGSYLRHQTSPFNSYTGMPFFGKVDLTKPD